MGDDEQFTEWLEQSNKDVEFISAVRLLIEQKKRIVHLLRHYPMLNCAEFGYERSRLLKYLGEKDIKKGEKYNLALPQVDLDEE